MPQRRAQEPTIGPPPVGSQQSMPPENVLQGNYADLLLKILGAVGDPLEAITSAPAGGALAMGKLIGRGGPRARIPRQQQNVDSAMKIPRFRSPAGDFVKFEDRWWRLKPFRQDATDLQLEYLGPGAKTPDAKVLESRTIAAKDFYESILKAKAPPAPKRRGG